MLVYIEKKQDRALAPGVLLFEHVSVCDYLGTQVDSRLSGKNSSLWRIKSSTKKVPGTRLWKSKTQTEFHFSFALIHQV